jgi:hypothetical protein
MSNDEGLSDTKRLMGALLRMPPKPHSEMKIGKPVGKKKVRDAKKPKQRRGI